MVKPIAAIVHIYYAEIWSELKDCLNHITQPYDLYITTIEQNKYLENDIRAFKTDASFEIVDNRGYDIAPFVHILNKINLDDYSYIIKLHTKRNLKHPVKNIGTGFGCCGNQWRKWLLQFLYPHNFVKCINALETNPQIGACCYYKCLHPIKNFSGLSEEIREKYKDYIFGLKNFSFVAGTMFVIRAGLLKDIQKMAITTDMFEVPNETHSIQFAHIIERTLGEVVYYNHCCIKDVFTPFAATLIYLCSLKTSFLQFLSFITPFFFQQKITKSNKHIIKICKLPVFSRKVC